MKRIMRLCLLCLLWICFAGCGDKKVDYIEDELRDTEEWEFSDLDEEEPGEWVDAFTVERENGGTLSVKIRTEPDSRPDTSEIVEVGRIELDERTAEQMARAVLGDDVVCEDGIYTGTREGIEYRMEIGQRRILFYPADIAQVAPEQLKDAPKIHCETTIMDSGNQCELKEGYAGEFAEQFLEELGLSEKSWCSFKSLVWIDDEKGLGMTPWADNERNGYAFFFLQTFQGEWMRTLIDDTELNEIYIWQDRENGADVTDTKMHAAVCVNDHGVFAADIQNPYVILSTEEVVHLLPVRNILDIMQKELTEHADYYASEDDEMLFYRRMRFGHRLIWDDAGRCGSYVPVWILSDSGTRQDTAIIVNAIDGSIVSRDVAGEIPKAKE